MRFLTPLCCNFSAELQSKYARILAAEVKTVEAPLAQPKHHWHASFATWYRLKQELVYLSFSTPFLCPHHNHVVVDVSLCNLANWCNEVRLGRSEPHFEKVRVLNCTLSDSIKFRYAFSLATDQVQALA